MSYNFENVVSQFNVEGKLISCERYGEGHINETYLAILENGGVQTKYILQKLNDKLFTDMDKLLNNISLVTNFNRAKIAERGGNPDRESLTIVSTKDGKPYLKTDEGYFVIKLFITDAIAYQTSPNPEIFYQSAMAFGNFANLLAEFDASKLYEIIPDFHNTEKRFRDFEQAIKEDKCGRASSVKEEIEFYVSRKPYASRIVSLLRSGEMPTKVTHNDTKLNNVMIDANTHKYVAVIDLDTIMPGSICYDFGDSIRFGCNPAAEDEPDLSKVIFSLELFEAYTKGYLTALGDSVTKIEKDNLAFGAILMTYECGMRFLTDYLNGDTYFHTTREGQNLDRTRTQIHLVKQMEKLLPTMEAIVNKY